MIRRQRGREDLAVLPDPAERDPAIGYCEEMFPGGLPWGGGLCRFGVASGTIFGLAICAVLGCHRAALRISGSGGSSFGLTRLGNAPRTLFGSFSGVSAPLSAPCCRSVPFSTAMGAEGALRNPAFSGVSWSERRDLNSGPPVPQTGALTGLRYAPPGQVAGGVWNCVYCRPIAVGAGVGP